ncbi:hypothetical protein MA16_Dca026826 [Dendrobium catenatum]|uniref:Uncharacterized protein n=1 Tax=Dendrobium catenatum TaxID=906689 RepID=A0A2I0VFD7_9ASPA|nr:hypothetical protein MA16_Dca026826 [Dendrobium catenatum]
MILMFLSKCFSAYSRGVFLYRILYDWVDFGVYLSGIKELVGKMAVEGCRPSLASAMRTSSFVDNKNQNFGGNSHLMADSKQKDFNLDNKVLQGALGINEEERIDVGSGDQSGSIKLEPKKLNTNTKQIEEGEITLGQEQCMEDIQAVGAVEFDGQINKDIQKIDGDMGMVLTHVSSFLPMDVNKFDILSMENDDKVEDGVYENRVSDNGVEDIAIMVDVIGLWKDGRCGGRNYIDNFDCSVVKEFGNVEELTKFMLAKELKSLEPIKNAPSGRNLENGSKRRDGGSSPWNFLSAGVHHGGFLDKNLDMDANFYMLPSFWVEELGGTNANTFSIPDFCPETKEKELEEGELVGEQGNEVQSLYNSLALVDISFREGGMSTEGRWPPAAGGPSEERRTTRRNSVGSVRDVSSSPLAFGDGKIKLFTVKIPVITKQELTVLSPAKKIAVNAMEKVYVVSRAETESLIPVNNSFNILKELEDGEINENNTNVNPVDTVSYSEVPDSTMIVSKEELIVTNSFGISSNSIGTKGIEDSSQSSKRKKNKQLKDLGPINASIRSRRMEMEEKGNGGSFPLNPFK